jgi:hypothetical protein
MQQLRVKSACSCPKVAATGCFRVTPRKIISSSPLCNPQPLLLPTCPHRTGQHTPHAKQTDTEQPSASSPQQETSASSSSNENTSTSSQDGGASRLLLLGGLVAAAGAILVTSGGLGGLKEKVHDLEGLITASGNLGPLIYGAAYTASTVLLFPASVLTLAAGYLFGRWLRTQYAVQRCSMLSNIQLLMETRHLSDVCHIRTGVYMCTHMILSV